jgi:hypothetical protein
MVVVEKMEIGGVFAHHAATLSSQMRLFNRARTLPGNTILQLLRGLGIGRHIDLLA